MDPKISKKTQDTLGKLIKKPPLTDKLLSKPPFRFLHDIMTSVIKTTGVMKGLYSDAELNSENVKDKDSKIAFLQKAIDFVGAASGKPLSVKPAKVVAGHEPEKTNEFLQALATSINSKVDNDAVLEKLGNKGGSSKKEEKKDKEEKSKDRERSGDRRKRDEEKRGREKSQEKEKSRDREEKHKEKEDRHKEKEDRHKDRDRDRERESRHKSGRSRSNERNKGEQKVVSMDVDSDDLAMDSDEDNQPPPDDIPMNTTFAVTNPAKIHTYSDKQDTGIKLIPRQVSTYREMNREVTEEEAHFVPEESRMKKRPKAARPRRGKMSHVSPADDPPTPYVSEDNSAKDEATFSKKELHRTRKNADMETRRNTEERKSLELEESPQFTKEYSGQSKQPSGMKKVPRTSTPKNSPDTPTKNSKIASIGKSKGKDLTPSSKYGASPETLTGGIGKKGYGKKTMDSSERPGTKRGIISKPVSQNTQQKARPSQKTKVMSREMQKDSFEDSLDDTSGVSEIYAEKKSKNRGKKSHKPKRRSRHHVENQTEESESDPAKQSREKHRYRNDDYEHDKVKKSKRHKNKHQIDYDDDVYPEEPSMTDTTDEYDNNKNLKSKGGSRNKHHKSNLTDKYGEEYYIRKKPRGAGDKRKRSSFSSMLDSTSDEKREEESKENDAPRKDMVNGDANHKPADAAPAKMQRPSSAKGSRRRMEGGLDSSDEDVPVQRNEPQLGEDDIPPQVAGRMNRPSSARPAPPKRKDDVVHNEPAMRLGSGKPQNLIIDDGKESDEDETFVVEDSAPQPVEPEMRVANENDDEDEDHGGLVKKIMETKKEYEQQRKTEIERPTVSDAQRRKQREAVQREIDKLRTSIQTLTRSANPLGKIMDYVQEDLDSMQKELEKWKTENKEHALALKREKAITDRAVEPLKVQLTEVDQAIKDQLELIGAVKSNIIRNDQKIEKMLRTIAKS